LRSDRSDRPGSSLTTSEPWPSLESGLGSARCWRLHELWTDGGGGEREVGKAVNVDLVGSLLGLAGDVHTLLGGDELDELVTVFTDDDGPEVTGHVMPDHAVVVLVVQHGQAGLVVELLETLDGDADVVLSIDGSLLYSLIVIRLRFSFLSSPAPERLARSGSVSWSNPVVVGSGPEPSIDIDGREVRRVTTLVLEIAFSATCVDGGHIISLHDFGKHLELSGCIERHKIHTTISAEVASIEPVPVLKLVPGLPPGQKIVMVTNFHVRFSLHTLC